MYNLLRIRDGPSYGLYMFLYELILREGKKYSTNGWGGDGLLALIAGGVTGKMALLLNLFFVIAIH